MGRGSGGPPSFSQKIPVGFHSEINLSAKGMRKIENGEKFLRFRDQILKHLPVCDVVSGFGGESKKVVGGGYGHRSGMEKAWKRHGKGSISWKWQKSVLL